MIGLNLIAPLETHAHPEYGFTPPPPPKPTSPSPTDDDADQDEDGDDGGQPPSNRVTIQIEGCNLSCSTGAALALTQNNNTLAQTAGPDSYSLLISHEMLAQVRLIHEGSGWIAEGVISDAKPVSFAVPYPGQWQVFLISEPEFASGEALDLAGTDIEELQASLSQAPVLLGVVEANTAEPQRVACPLNCPAAVSASPAPASASPAPAALPETGAPGVPVPALPFIGSGILWVLAFLSYKVYRSQQ